MKASGKRLSLKDFLTLIKDIEKQKANQKRKEEEENKRTRHDVELLLNGHGF